MKMAKQVELEIEALPREEQRELLNRLQDKLEDDLELTDEFKAKIEQGKKDIAEGRCRIVHP
jgi:hypothetical protein